MNVPYPEFGGATFYTADLHLGHANVLRHCARPFDTVAEMDRAIIDRWNRAVSGEDTVWVLGDVCLDKRKLSLVKELNGYKILVAGNHDTCHRMHRKWPREEERYLDAGFEHVWTRGVYQGHYLTDSWNGSVDSMMFAPVDLAHLPYEDDSQAEDRFTEWRPADEGRVLLCGHVHEAWKTRGRMVNVGVDQWDFTPVSQAALLPIINSLPEGPAGPMDESGQPRPA